MLGIYKECKKGKTINKCDLNIHQQLIHPIEYYMATKSSNEGNCQKQKKYPGHTCGTNDKQYVMIQYKISL